MPSHVATMIHEIFADCFMRAFARNEPIHVLDMQTRVSAVGLQAFLLSVTRQNGTE